MTKWIWCKLYLVVDHMHRHPAVASGLVRRHQVDPAAGHSPALVAAAPAVDRSHQAVVAAVVTEAVAAAAAVVRILAASGTGLDKHQVAAYHQLKVSRTNNNSISNSKC